MVKNLIKYQVILLVAIAAYKAQAQEQYFMSLGNHAYVDSNYVAADSLYSLGAKLNLTDPLRFNQGLAAYKSESPERAQQLWSEIKDESVVQDALFNKATAYMQQGNMDQAIDGFKALLRYNPNHKDAQHNLSLALLSKSQQQQQEQQEQENQDQENSEDQQSDDQQQEKSEEDGQNEGEDEKSKPDDQQSESDKDSEQQQEEGEQGESDQQDQPSEENPSPQQSQETEGEQKDVTQAELLQLLQILENEDKKVQRKVQGTEGTGKPRDKDW